MLLFAIPLMLTGVLQQVYNMADNIIVGRFSGDPDALAAVGSTSSLTALIINCLLGIGGGSSVVIAQFFGARDEKSVSRTVHTSMTFSFIGGLVFTVIGIACAKPALTLMGTNKDLLEKAVLYMTIICLGIPASSIYNFGAAVLRSVGDSKTSLYILSTSGIINVLLNLLFVIVFNMSIAGVALATIISQYASAAAVVIVLVKRKEVCYNLNFRKLRIEKNLLARIMRFGVPIALQSSLFSLSNIVFTSAVNTFPKHTISAKTIAFNIEVLTYTSMNAFSQAAMTFAAQNYGAKKYRRLNRIAVYAILSVAAVGILISQIEIFFGRELALLYIESSDPNKEAVISDVLEIFKTMLTTYFLCGIMEVMSGVLKGIGYSVSSMVCSLIGLGVRVGWVLLLTPTARFHTIFGLVVAYPLSWGASIILLGAALIYAWHKRGIWCGARTEKLNITKEKEYENAY
jgi:putative MATE family efflux protein